MRHPHIEILVGADETRVGDLFASVSGVIDRALEPDGEVEGVELVKLDLFGAADRIGR